LTLSATEDGLTHLEWTTRKAPDQLEAQLAAYYPVRVNHLRAALGLPAQDCVSFVKKARGDHR
jgi:hypothetical protein